MNKKCRHTIATLSYNVNLTKPTMNHRGGVAFCYYTAAGRSRSHLTLDRCLSSLPISGHVSFYVSLPFSFCAVPFLVAYVPFPRAFVVVPLFVCAWLLFFGRRPCCRCHRHRCLGLEQTNPDPFEAKIYLPIRHPCRLDQGLSSLFRRALFLANSWASDSFQRGQRGLCDYRAVSYGQLFFNVIWRIKHDEWMLEQMRSALKQHA